VVTDAAMNDLLRPALYDAWHEVLPVTGVTARRSVTTLWVRSANRRIFSPGDARSRSAAGDLPRSCRQALTAMTMSSNYNSRRVPAGDRSTGKRLISSGSENTEGFLRRSVFCRKFSVCRPGIGGQREGAGVHVCGDPRVDERSYSSRSHVGGFLME